jgi:hypothetical protein
MDDGKWRMDDGKWRMDDGKWNLNLNPNPACGVTRE